MEGTFWNKAVSGVLRSKIFPIIGLGLSAVALGVHSLACGRRLEGVFSTGLRERVLSVDLLALLRVDCSATT